MEVLEFGKTKVYRIEVGASTYLVASKGFRLLNWFLTLADGSTRDVVYMPDNADLASADFAVLRGGMPILFPFAGVSFADGKRDFWKTPDGRVLPMKKHGYAIDGDFEIFEMSDTSLKAVYKPSAAARAAYPFNYEFSATFRFAELSFNCELMLVNNSGGPLPWGAGLHPYFQLPWHAGASRKDYRLMCEAKKVLHIKDDGSFEPADAAQNCFADADVCNRIHTKLKSNVVKFGSKNGEEDVSIKFGLDEKPELGATIVSWSESEDAPYYCVEPWMNPPNCASKPIHFVDAGKSGSFVVEFSLF